MKSSKYSQHISICSFYLVEEKTYRKFEKVYIYVDIYIHTPNLKHHDIVSRSVNIWLVICTVTSSRSTTTTDTEVLCQFHVQS